MNLLLDTRVVLWALAGDPRLTGEARDAVVDPDNLAAVSAASAWEIAIKKALGKLDAPDDLASALAESDFSPLVITVEHAEAAGALPPHHSDPFDRMLVAQALVEGLTVVTADPRFADYGCTLLPA